MRSSRKSSLSFADLASPSSSLSSFNSLGSSSRRRLLPHAPVASSRSFNSGGKTAKKPSLDMSFEVELRQLILPLLSPDMVDPMNRRREVEAETVGEYASLVGIALRFDQVLEVPRSSILFASTFSPTLLEASTAADLAERLPRTV